MTKKTKESLIEFPCDFTFKIICKKSPEVKQQLIQTLSILFEQVDNSSLKEKHSKNNNYCSYSITVNAPDKSTVDKAYQELNTNKNVIMLF